MMCDIFWGAITNGYEGDMSANKKRFNLDPDPMEITNSNGLKNHVRIGLMAMNWGIYGIYILNKPTWRVETPTKTAEKRSYRVPLLGLLVSVSCDAS